MNWSEQFNAFITKNQLFLPVDKLLLAVSGGLDSMVLADLCRLNAFDFRVAHCNFQLRGAESDRDESFVRDWCNQHQIPFQSIRFDTNQYASQNNVSIQVAARELRYGWFAELMGVASVFEPGPSSIANAPHYLLTAHHLDDSIETSLMNFFKGTGISGIRGMLPRQGRLIRPLLFARKEQLLDYAKDKGLSWVEDSSNELDKYSRNYFRHQLIPIVNSIYPMADQNLAHNLSRFREVELLYNQAIALHKGKLLEQKGAEWHLPVLKLKKAQPITTIVYEIIREFGFSPAQVAETIALLDSDSGKFIRSATHRIIRHRKWLIIAPDINEQAELLVIDGPGTWSYPEGTLTISEKSKKMDVESSNGSVEMIDASRLEFPLILRKWKTGDYFYPLGMKKKKKKVSRFLIDLKLSKTAKESQWLLEYDKQIVWVLGRRIDERFKVGPQTEKAVRIEIVNYKL